MVVGFSRFYLAATLSIDLDYSPQERLLPIRQVLCTTKTISCTTSANLKVFFSITTITWSNKTHMKGIPLMHFSSSTIRVECVSARWHSCLWPRCWIKNTMTPTRFELIFPPWKGGVLTDWTMVPSGRDRNWTYDVYHEGTDLQSAATQPTVTSHPKLPWQDSNL